ETSAGHTPVQGPGRHRRGTHRSAGSGGADSPCAGGSPRSREKLMVKMEASNDRFGLFTFFPRPFRRTKEHDPQACVVYQTWDLVSSREQLKMTESTLSPFGKRPTTSWTPMGFPRPRDGRPEPSPVG